MKIVYGKTLTPQQTQTVGEIASACDIMFDTARLLLYRDIDTVDKAKAFLSPGKSGFLDPFLLSGMRDAVERIEKAKLNNERVLVFGDYDADGVCATTVLYYCLKEFGINADIYVPEREEGYGINLDTIEKLNANHDLKLMITVDCGISDKDKIKILNDNDVDVIVTDHHEPPTEIPDTICINPKLSGQDYPFDGLCGAGVAYKLGRALISDAADKYLDYVALATVADSMDLVKENRDIVVEGLKLLNNQRTQRLSFKYLLGDNNKQITAQTLAYVIAPRINAGGRMGDAATSLKIFTTEDPNKIFDLAAKLSEYNVARQMECDNIYHQAKEMISRDRLDENAVIMVKDEKWQAGFVGIVAAKLVEDYSRPVIVFAGYDGYYKGSARSVDGVNIHDAITSAKDILLSFGGHAQAAGVSVSKENFSALSDALNRFVNNLDYIPDGDKTIFAEWNVDKPLSLRFAREIDQLEPFGVGNRRPVFTTEVDAIESLPLKAGSNHYSYRTDVLEMLDFNGEKNVYTLSLPIKKKVVFELNLSVYRNRESLKGYVRNVTADYGDFSALMPHVFENEISKLKFEPKKNFQTIDKEQVKSLIKNGTALAVSNPENLKLYPELANIKTDAFTTDKVGGAVVLVSPKVIPDGFDTVLYIDKPLGLINTNAKIKVVDSVCGYSFISNVSTERSVFAEYFNKLLGLKGKTIKSTAQFVLKHFSDDEIYQAIFCLETFLELGIFKILNNVLTYDEKIKNALTNSKVYSKIYLIKG
ncbi:MAG: single-stranded-DNA-specific exonuclease RecJ [Clostridia bacterium]|nr:single-stranded-DNA-specific exonuclease RecJ [Clostridia bacterium]